MRKKGLVLSVAILVLFMFVACNNEVKKPEAPNEIVSRVVDDMNSLLDYNNLGYEILYWVNVEHSDENKETLITNLINYLGLDEGCEIKVDDDSIEIKGVCTNESYYYSLSTKITGLAKNTRIAFKDGAKGNLTLSFAYKDSDEDYNFNISGAFVFDDNAENSFTFSEVSFNGKSYDVISFTAVMDYILNRQYM